MDQGHIANRCVLRWTWGRSWRYVVRSGVTRWDRWRRPIAVVISASDSERRIVVIGVLCTPLWEITVSSYQKQ